jgi:methionyl-tRNA formyltransferase
MTIDLLVGGTLGAWALRNAPAGLVNQVVCVDEGLAALATRLGHTVHAGDPRSDAAFTSGAAALSVHFPLILDAEFIARYDGAIWNLHPGLLPWGRGMYPVFWALWEGTPAGATLHELTVGLDQGPIVEQQRVAVLPSDTGGRLHERVQGAERDLFQRWLPRLASGERPQTTPQLPGGSYHTRAEFEHLRDEGRYEVPRADRERLVRCLTFPNHPALSMRNIP